MSISVVSFLCAAVAGWAAWLLSRHYILPSPLDRIPGPPRQSFWLGNMAALFGTDAWEMYGKLRAYGSVSKLHGILGTKNLFTYDPKLLQHMLLKNQQIFKDPDWFNVYCMACFGPGLLSVHGEQHKKQRKMLNAAFSVAQMRRITPMLYRTARTLRRAIQSELQAASQEVDMLAWLNRSALDSIGQGGLGYSFDALHKDTSNEFAKAMIEFTPAFSNLAAVAPIAQHLMKLGTAEFRRRVLDHAPLGAVRQLKRAVDSMAYHSVKIYTEKKAANTMSQGTNATEDGADAILAALISANEEADAEDRLLDEELIAQMSTIVFAATDTTTTSMSRVLHLLAQHFEVQERIRAEVIHARDGQDIDYDRLVQLTYLDAVCKETLRMYPPTPLAFKQAKEDAVLPLAFPIRDTNGQEQQEIFIAKGTMVFVGIQEANRHKTVWGDDADVWKPERWLSPLPDTVLNARVPGVYSHMMTFYGGIKVLHRLQICRN